MSARRTVALLLAAGLVGVGCGSSGEAESGAPAVVTEAPQDAAVPPATGRGIRLVQAVEVAPLVDGNVTVIDVRTPEEFASGHLEGATMIDFYEADFAEQIAALDPDGEYLVYCRSGNRSGQTVALMEQLGFSDVADLDGGVLAYEAAGLDLVP